MGLGEHIAKEWGVLKQAPIAFALCLVGGLGGGYTAAAVVYGERITVLEERLRLKDDRIDFTTQQLDTLRGQLATVAPASVEIIGDVSDTKLAEAVAAGGWNVEMIDLTAQPPVLDWKGVLLAAPDDESGRGIIQAFRAADVPFTVAPLQAGETPQIWLHGPQP